jgi:hypothetical protein
VSETPLFCNAVGKAAHDPSHDDHVCDLPHGHTGPHVANYGASGTRTWGYDPAAHTLPYERLSSPLLLSAVKLFDGERLLVLQPFGWHINGTHIPNAPEQFSRESICEEHGWYVVCDYGDYVAVVRPAGKVSPK